MGAGRSHIDGRKVQRHGARRPASGSGSKNRHGTACGRIALFSNENFRLPCAFPAMKRLTIFPFAMLFALAASARLAAADPQSNFGLAPTPPGSLQPAPSSPAPEQLSPAPAPAPAGVPLIPDTLPAADKPSAEAGKSMGGLEKTNKPNQTVLEEDKLHKRIQYRRAMTKALRDPGLNAMKETALKSKTDFEYRKRFIDYYNGLFDLLEKIDKTLDHDEMEVMRKACTNRYLESRIQGAVDPATFRKPKQ
jgi:hypothetical protein